MKRELSVLGIMYTVRTSITRRNANPLDIFVNHKITLNVCMPSQFSLNVVQLLLTYANYY